MDEMDNFKSINVSLQALNDKYLMQQKEVNDALEESMAQNEQSEQEKNALSMELQKTIEQLNGMKNLITNKDTEISWQVQ